VKSWLQCAANVRPLLEPSIAIDDVLDTGGQGVVYRGLIGGVKAAVKVYLPGQVEERIEREVAALGELACPSIAKLLWHGKVAARGENLHVVATELIEGEALARIVPQRRLDGTELAMVTLDVANAIGAMWGRRIVHRDLKPGNILVRPNHRACVIDLGLARHLDESSLTAAGATWGTRGYLSPEQCRGARALTCHSDVFSLGVVILEAAAGRHPTGRDQNRLLATPFHQTLIPEVASWAHAELLRRMLDPRAHRRPSPATILAALRVHGPPA
jgi:eukaryotic-like serine/threonine-protein kinase